MTEALISPRAAQQDGEISVAVFPWQVCALCWGTGVAEGMGRLDQTLQLLDPSSTWIGNGRVAKPVPAGTVTTDPMCQEGKAKGTTSKPSAGLAAWQDYTGIGEGR